MSLTDLKPVSFSSAVSDKIILLRMEGWVNWG